MIRDRIAELRDVRTWLNQQAASNGGMDATHQAMRQRFNVWRALRRETRYEARQTRKVMQGTAAPGVRVVKRVAPSQRKGRLVQKGGPRNLWRTFPPR